MKDFFIVVLALYLIQIAWSVIFLIMGAFETKDGFIRALNPFKIFIIIYQSYKNLE